MDLTPSGRVPYFKTRSRTQNKLYQYFHKMLKMIVTFSSRTVWI